EASDADDGDMTARLRCGTSDGGPHGVSSTERGRGVFVGNVSWEQDGPARVRDRVLRVRAVDIDPRQRGTRAVGRGHEAVHVLFATEVASPTALLHHGQTDAITDLAFRNAVANRHDFSHPLVSEHQ